MAASWLVLRGILSIAAGIGLRKRAGAGSMLLGILLGILEIGMGAYSFAHPAVLAVSLGILIGLFYIETGVNSIIIGSFTCEGGNGVTVLLTFMGLLMIVCGISMFETPLLTFLKTGYWIIALFFIHGVLGVIRSIGMKRFGWDFLFALLSLGLGIAGIMIPDVAAMNNAILLYMAAAWFVLHGILAILASFRVRKQGGGIGLMLLGILLGIVEIALGGYCAAHPAVLALSLGLLIAIFFVESGVHMIIIGSSFSRAVAIRQARLLAAAPAAEAEAAEAQAVEAAMAAEAAEAQAVEAAEAQAAAEAMAAESEETAPSGEETQQ